MFVYINKCLKHFCILLDQRMRIMYIQHFVLGITSLHQTFMNPLDNEKSHRLRSRLSWLGRSHLLSKWWQEDYLYHVDIFFKLFQLAEKWSSMTVLSPRFPLKALKAKALRPPQSSVIQRVFVFECCDVYQVREWLVMAVLIARVILEMCNLFQLVFDIWRTASIVAVPELVGQ